MRLCKSHLAQLAGLPMHSKPDSQNLLRYAYRIFIMTRSLIRANHIMLLVI
jgi:hypothetical protein